MHDTNDRAWWYIHGQKLEEKFVTVCNSNLGLTAMINPAKQKDVTAPDLIVNGVVSDLKTQNTPFFTSGRYGVDPRYAVTFNRKDYHRYKAKYPEIMVYFWIEWSQTRYRHHKVDYLAGVWHTPFKSIASMIENGAPEHWYIKRALPNMVGAKSSFVFDVRGFDCDWNSDSVTQWE